MGVYVHALKGERTNHPFDLSYEHQFRINNVENGFLPANRSLINLGFRAEYFFNYRWKLKAQPKMSYSISYEQKIKKYLSVKPFNVGLDIGIAYRSRKKTNDFYHLFMIVYS